MHSFLLTGMLALLAACGDGPTAADDPGTAVAAWLADHPRVAAALVWDAGDGAGPKPYEGWSAADKSELERAVADAAKGAERSLSDPPVNLMAGVLPIEAAAMTVLSSGDARGLYFTHVGRSLMLEMTRALPWSIADYAPADLAVLLDSRSFFLWKRRVGGTSVSGYAIFDDTATFIATSNPASANGFVVPAPPKVTVQFLTENKIVADDRLTTIQRLLEWSRMNLSHMGGDITMDGTLFHWRYAGVPPVSLMIAGTTTRPAPTSTFGHWTAGCPGTNWFLMAVLRTVNIPVRYVVVEEHATPYFATEGKYLSHGDDPYSSGWSPSTPRAPIDELLIDATTYSTWFSPTLSPAQRLANIGRQTKELGIKYLSNTYLHHRCADVSAGVVSHAQSALYSDFRSIYTLAELEAMDLWNRFDAKLASLGGCDKLPPLGGR